MSGHLEEGIQIPMARGRSTESKWIRTSRLSIKNSLSSSAVDLQRSCSADGSGFTGRGLGCRVLGLGFGV